MILQGFAEAIVGIQTSGTLSLPDPDDPDTVRFLRVEREGENAWRYLMFHFSPDDHVLFSLN